MAADPGETICISSHGHVIGLFLNRLQAWFGGDQTKGLRHPDIIKFSDTSGQFEWDRAFEVPGLSNIATSYTHARVRAPPAE